MLSGCAAGGGGGGSGERRVVLAGAGAAVGPSPLTQESLELFLNHLYGGPSVKLATVWPKEGDGGSSWGRMQTPPAEQSRLGGT